MYDETPWPNLPRFDHDRGISFFQSSLVLDIECIASSAESPSFLSRSSLLLSCNTSHELSFVLHVELRNNRTSMTLSKICGHKGVIPRQFKIWTRAESPSLMTPRSRRNKRISSACGIVSIFIESSFLSLPRNLSDPFFL